MELNDCAFPTLNRVVATDDARVAFKDCHVALLVGARPRGPGMERKDLLLANAQIFSAQGKALDAVADRGVRVLVVGNPANTNALIAMKNAPGLAPGNFTAMVRLDHNRALSQLAEKTGTHVTKLKRMTIWGNHSSTQYPDLHHATVDGKPALSLVDAGLVSRAVHPGRAAARRRDHQGARRFLRRVGSLRPRSITSATGCWARPKATGSAWRCRRTAATASRPASSTAIRSPARTARYQIVQGLAVNEFSRDRMDATHRELTEERDGVRELL